jgi:hypothetical protein
VLEETDLFVALFLAVNISPLIIISLMLARASRKVRVPHSISSSSECVRLDSIGGLISQLHI